MGFEKVYLAAKVELDVSSTEGAEFKIDTDIPGGLLAFRVSVHVPVMQRRILQQRLPYTLQGKLFRFTYNPGTGKTYLFGVRLWARELPTGAWGWIPLPVVPTPNEWQSAHIEIPPTGDWTAVKLEVPPTSDAYQEAALSIAATPDDWRSVPLQIPPTPDLFSEMGLPIKPTPPLPDWMRLEVDG